MAADFMHGVAPLPVREMEMKCKDTTAEDEIRIGV
jgi:hypothetical protein